MYFFRFPRGRSRHLPSVETHGGRRLSFQTGAGGPPSSCRVPHAWCLKSRGAGRRSRQVSVGDSRFWAIYLGGLFMVINATYKVIYRGEIRPFLRLAWRIIPGLGPVVWIIPIYKRYYFGHLQGGPTTRSLGDLRSPWLWTTYKCWDDPPSMAFHKILTGHLTIPIDPGYKISY